MTKPKVILVGFGMAALVIIVGVVYASQLSASTMRNQSQPAASLRSQEDIGVLGSLWIGSLPQLPPDPSNAVADDPRAAKLGHRIFFDTRFSANGEVSCATCHKPELFFTDGLAQAQGIGQTSRSAPTIVGTAYSPWFFWDGRRDSQWAQALGPMESPVEHGGTRTQYTHIIARDETYRAEYEALFGPLPNLSDRTRFPENAGPVDDPDAQLAWETMTPEDRKTVTQIYANIGKAIAAYERLIVPSPSRFDIYVQALLDRDEETMKTALTPDEVAGLRLFGQGNCLRCHNGPLFTSNSFHNIGVSPADGLPPDFGRIKGVQQVVDNEFNCLGQFSDAGLEDCAELRFAKTIGQELVGAFKVPTLRNVAETAPYMHAGQFATLGEVLDHYSRAETGPLGHNDLEPC